MAALTGGRGPARILTVNAGSSSLKVRLVGEGDIVLADHQVAAPEGRFDEKDLAATVGSLEGVDAAGFRVVHGGESFTGPVALDGEVERRLASLAALAPLHQGAALEAIRACRRLLPGVPAVACFDTAFHATLPAAAREYAVPPEWRRLGVRRFGFHGLSHRYAAGRAAQMLGRRELRCVTCHLGSGASLAAVQDGRSVDTTMGFTPLDGLVMATRSGGVDPGLVLWVQEREGLTPAQAVEALDRRSGLAGLAGSPDMREVLARRESGDEAAGLAVEVYVHRLRAHIAAMAAAMDGLDALVFTGGVGERAPALREEACRGLSFLGVAVDPDRNRGAEPDAEIGAAGAAARTLVVEAREDLEIAREVRVVVGRA